MVTRSIGQPFAKKTGHLSGSVKARAKLGARLVMSPRSASAVDQIACGCRKRQRSIADEVNKLARFDAESPKTHTLLEATYFAGLRKAGMPEE
jgi:hypothetical protein